MLRPMRPLTCLRVCPSWIFATLLALAPAARADDVFVSVDAKKAVGARPRLLLQVKKDLATVEVELRAEGRAHRFSKGPAKAGEELAFELPHDEPGRRRWQGSLSVRFVDGASGSMPLAFETEVASPPRAKLLSGRDEILKQHRVAIEMDRPAAKVDVEVYGDEGALLASTSKTFDGAPAGTRLEVSWIPRVESPVLRVKVTAWDTDGLFITNESFPYVISIPHEEVEFETGKATIRDAELPKLEAAREALEREVKRYARAVAIDQKRIRLFVAGHTDTVGSPAHNRQLSTARARAIARWFKRAGVDVPIYFRGFGEEYLKVATPDETDEARNRRVDYDIAVEAPTGSLDGWTRL